jgi:hypothetical protein
MHLMICSKCNTEFFVNDDWYEGRLKENGIDYMNSNYYWCMPCYVHTVMVQNDGGKEFKDRIQFDIKRRYNIDISRKDIDMIIVSHEL